VARVLRMPGVAANATEAVLAEWLVAESDYFEVSDAIATVETEKAAVDVEAEAAGRLLRTLVPAGAQVEVGAAIAVLADLGEEVDDLDALLTSLGVSVGIENVVPPRRNVPTESASAAPGARPSAPQPAPEPAANGRVFASPLARKIAKDRGLSIAEIRGTGPRGRILRRDVDETLAARTVLPEAAHPVTPSAPEALGGAAYDELPHSLIRLATARRLVESKQTVPHFYLRATVRAEALLALRAEINEEHDEQISINDLVIKAVAGAHRRVPEMNVTWSEDAVRRYHSVDVAIAVATERGLLTPVVRDVGALTVTALSATVRDLAQRAREGRLKQQELEGGTISVTNLGMFGVEEFGAIINPPHAAILAVGGVRREAVVDADLVVPGQVMTVTLSVDHRPVDGVLAARWMAQLVALLQHPVRLLT
jgi:pyruvate dehydrogenase E2 component (dihydrolipoamide acetyltransferase)